MIVADNVSEHMLGNIYVKYFNEEDAEKALQKLTGKYYSGRLIRAEFSPVTDFREARCRAFHEARCNRGGYCNFLHKKHIPRANKKRLLLEMYEDFPHYAHKKERILKADKNGMFPNAISALQGPGGPTCPVVPGLVPPGFCGPPVVPPVPPPGSGGPTLTPQCPYPDIVVVPVVGKTSNKAEDAGAH